MNFLNAGRIVLWKQRRALFMAESWSSLPSDLGQVTSLL